MKLFTATKKKVFSLDYGWLEEIKFKFLGFTYLTERHFAEVLDEKKVHDIEEMAMYLEWRDKCHLPHVDNEQFEKVLTNKF